MTSTSGSSGILQVSPLDRLLTSRVDRVTPPADSDVEPFELALHLQVAHEVVVSRATKTGPQTLSRGPTVKNVLRRDLEGFPVKHLPTAVPKLDLRPLELSAG